MRALEGKLANNLTSHKGFMRNRSYGVAELLVSPNFGWYSRSNPGASTLGRLFGASICTGSCKMKNIRAILELVRQTWSQFQCSQRDVEFIWASVIKNDFSNFIIHYYNTKLKVGYTLIALKMKFSFRVGTYNVSYLILMELWLGRYVHCDIQVALFGIKAVITIFMFRVVDCLVEFYFFEFNWSIGMVDVKIKFG